MGERMRREWVAAIVAAALLSGCAATPPGTDFAASDPWEPFNRVMHNGNKRLDTYVLRPVAQGYGAATPDLFKLLIGNAFNQLDTINDTANFALQGEGTAALRAFGRFSINLILGAGGLLDPATEFGLPKEDSDFGVTLGKYGVAEGPFLVLPFLGPSTPRDLVGTAVDNAFDPLTYVSPFTALDGLSPSVTLVGVVDGRDRNADLIDDVLYDSPDSYVALRSIYLQRRRALVAGETGADALPDIFDTLPAN